ncbi:MAG: hypothetical protein HOJ67_10355 [Rhodospirillaceae bacterium]|jgi:hypothetical protein|nr:hypothetical protein [Rhodospirillales bacterium]MBT6219273.1 hypothetical protein [Rhodospirillaceae bacterium]MBT6362590.1 hypothetical protein [Rhodospirillaceae bacterium]
MDTHYFIQIDAAEAKSDPLIQEFMGVVGDKVILDFKELQQKKFMKFWPQFSIQRHEDGDFKCVFFGTYMVQMFGKERTGTMVSKMGSDVRRKSLLVALQEVLSTRRIYCAKGDLKVDGKDYQKWIQIKMPLRRNGEINEVVTFMTFSVSKNAVQRQKSE